MRLPLLENGEEIAGNQVKIVNFLLFPVSRLHFLVDVLVLHLLELSVCIYVTRCGITAMMQSEKVLYVL